MLLEAQGALEAGRCLLSQLSDSDRKPLAKQDAEAQRYIERIYPACRAILADAIEARVAAALSDGFFADLASQVSPPPANVPLAPLYPAGFSAPGETNPPSCDTIRLIEADPELWATPAPWDGKPQVPLFSGWKIEKDLIALTRSDTALIRTDLKVDDAELSGDVRVDSGECVFLILRSDLVVKFQPGEVRGSGGNLNVKVGYDNLKTSSLFAKVPEIRTGQWYPFRIILSGQALRIVFNGTEALNTVIARDPRLTGSRVTRAGYFGFGGIAGSGAFRNVRIKALTAAGQQALPHLRTPTPYHPETTVAFLEGPTNTFVSLVHNQVEAYQPDRHPIVRGILALEGAPYVQLSRKDIVADHFKVTGRLKFLGEGSVWFRVNGTLLFGVRCKAGETPFLVKHATGNFNSTDEENEGDKPQVNQDYPWELEYHEPAGVFRFNGKVAAISFATPDRDRTKTGPTQFGISSYNTKAQVTNVVFSRLAPGVPAPDPRAAQAKAYLDKGVQSVNQVLKSLKTGGRPGEVAGAAILEGPGPAATASVQEVIKVAETFRAARNWPTYLALLDANAQRFPESSEARKEAGAALDKAKADFESATGSAGIGDIGMDNVIREGSRLGQGFADADGRHVWLYIPEMKTLIQYDPAAGTSSARLALTIEPRDTVGRKGYLLCTETPAADTEKEAAPPPDDSEKEDVESPEPATVDTIHKIDLTTGTILVSTNMPAAGTILQMVGHPKQDRTYVCVNENVKPPLLDFSLFKIYLLDETTMTMKDTGASGMFMAVDPMGRYLYTGFHIRWRPGMAVDTGFLHVVPRDGRIDHLIRYRITADGLVFDSQRPAPGLGGRGIVADPSGKTVCYVADMNVRDPKDKRVRPFGVQAMKALRLNSVAGVYDAGNRPVDIAFNPALGEAYILTGSQIRRYSTATFELKGTVTLPPAVEKNPLVGLLAAPDGRSLLAAFAGKSAGVYIHPLRADAALREAAPLSPRVVESAEEMIRAGKAAEAKPILLNAARRLCYTAAGDQAARLLLEMEKSPWLDAGATLWQIPAPDIADDKDFVAAGALALPARGSETDSADADPAYPANDAFRDRLDELQSFARLAEEFPHSWLWQCHEAMREFPKSARLKIEAAIRLTQAGHPAVASVLLREALDLAGRKGTLSLTAWRLLDRIYEKQGDNQHRAAALGEALALDPRDPVTLARLGTVYAALNRPRKAQNARLLSWYLCPSQPALSQALQSAGVLPVDSPPEMDAAAIFKKAVSAVVLISHDRGNGTGFILGRNGLLLTNHHVVDGAEHLTVKIKAEDGVERSLSARIVASDVLRDVALLSLQGDIPAVTPLVLVNSDRVEPGEKVVAIGNPGIGTRVLMHTTTEGIISGRNRVMGGKTFFQISAAVNPGNSGGPLLNRYGQVIGMVTLKADLENVGFAVPATELLSFLEEQEQ